MPRQNEFNDIFVDSLSLIGLDILKKLIGPLLVYMVSDYVCVWGGVVVVCACFS